MRLLKTIPLFGGNAKKYVKVSNSVISGILSYRVKNVGFLSILMLDNLFMESEGQNYRQMQLGSRV